MHARYLMEREGTPADCSIRRLTALGDFRISRMGNGERLRRVVWLLQLDRGSPFRIAFHLVPSTALDAWERSNK